MLRHAFVHSFIAPTDEDEALQLRKTARRFLVEQFSGRGHQDDGSIRGECRRFRRFPHPMSEQRLHRLKQRLWLQHHALTSAKRAVVHGAVAILGEGAQILNVCCNEPSLPRPPLNAVFEWSSKKFRKYRDEVESHVVSSENGIMHRDDRRWNSLR